MSDYKTLRRLCCMGAKKFGRTRVLSNGLLYVWVCGDLHIRFDDAADLPTTMIYLRGVLVYKLDDCTEPLRIIREVMLLDELADA